MYLYVEEDSIDLFKEDVNFFGCELLVPPSTGVVEAGVLPSHEDLNIINHHGTTTKMPSTTFYQATTLKTLTTNQVLMHSTGSFSGAYLRPIYFGRIMMRISSFQQRAKWSFLAFELRTTDFCGLYTKST
jgi:hypothetical protein